MDTDEAERDLHVVGAGLVFDEVKGLKGEGLGAVHMGTGGSAEAQLQLAGVNAGKDFRAELAANEDDYEAGEDEINRQDQPAHADDFRCQSRVAFSELCEAALFFRLVAGSLFVATEKPYGEYGNKGAGKKVGGDHGEA